MLPAHCAVAAPQRAGFRPPARYPNATTPHRVSFLTRCGVAAAYALVAESERTIMSFEPIETQEDLDKIVGARLAREREKYADYDELKAAAGAASDLVAERDELASKLAAAQADILSAHVAAISAETGVPADLIVGDTPDAARDHAAKIRSLIDDAAAARDEVTPATPAPAGPVVSGVGMTPQPATNPLGELFG